MKKISISFGVIVALILVGGSFLFVQAAEKNMGVTIGKSTDIKVTGDIKGTESTTSNSEVKNKDIIGLSDGTSTYGNRYSSSTATSTEKMETGMDHRSVVAKFVNDLLLVANHDKGIGNQVKVIAQEQKDSASTTASAMEKVDSKDGFSTFFFGSDYNSLGVIKSELASTTNRIAELQALASSTSDVTVKTELNAQIQVLQNELNNIQMFVNTNESKFSLFGWFVKLFNK
jgi:hypothetical protein